jgi:integrase/recombinase XerD
MTTTTSSPSAVIAVAKPAFSNAKRIALGGFLAGYSGLTREACALDLRQFAAWCPAAPLLPFQARRSEIQCVAPELELASLIDVARTLPHLSGEEMPRV